ncbi:MAG: hypothetical protein EPN84_07390 [Legionella sp.]|nr:MAG: hypothetical protein EPN84_07390 [Legionella sp.]
MGLHKDPDDEHLFNDFNFDDGVEDIDHKKKVRRLLEEKLEKKRLREEFMDDFDELGGEFDWDELDK